MAIQQPRRFVTTDQGHADVFNKPIDTLYENDQELSKQISDVKTYVNEAIKEAKVPDASTTEKGVVRMSEDYKSQSRLTVPASKALFDLYSILLVDRGNIFQADFNLALGIGIWRVDKPSLDPATDHSPPGAFPKGNLYVTGSVTGASAAHKHEYVDDNGGIFTRVRRPDGSWSNWSAKNGGSNMALVASNNVKFSQTETYAQQVASGGGSANITGRMLVFKFIPKALGELRIYWEGLVELVSGTIPTDNNSNWGITVGALGSNAWSAGDNSDYVEYAVQRTVFNYRDAIGTVRDYNTSSNVVSTAAKPGFNSWFGSEGVVRVTTPGPVYLAFYIYAANYQSPAFTMKGSIRNIQVCYDEVTP
ncbi:hypothetical protein MLD56_16210 [Paenibacillus peoriae]|uniref:hypothetical protein n=1 Tax=Paenibacillus peoriae TaxID=59893 RepID=UPI001F138197|nr:hypothetical protein [Paenibacillus peoriae]UMY53117.1 hypothetical protein MLD56_16210 [Paenibacillus peoriae]